MEADGEDAAVEGEGEGGGWGDDDDVLEGLEGLDIKDDVAAEGYEILFIFSHTHSLMHSLTHALFHWFLISSRADDGYYAPPTKGTAPSQLWANNSSLAGDLITAGAFETAMQVCASLRSPRV
jgi:hypothetical protein